MSIKIKTKIKVEIRSKLQFILVESLNFKAKQFFLSYNTLNYSIKKTQKCPFSTTFSSKFGTKLELPCIHII